MSSSSGPAVQGSLWEEVVCADGTPTLDPYAEGVVRHRLSRGAWVDLHPIWLRDGGSVMTDLVRDVPWQAERREMYQRTVDVPRLLSFYGPGEDLPHVVLTQAMSALGDHYADELGEPFVTAGLCYYRDGRDSVAWHGDRIGRGNTADTMVAILSLGATRRLLLRPRGGGSSLAFALGQGDLIVMGGSCQRTWEHALPKTTEPVGGRVSVQFRVSGVR